MSRALVVRHVPHEDLGAFASPLAALGFDIAYHDAWAAPPLSIADALAASLLVVLGGPMGVYEMNAYPFLRDERRALEARIAEDRPTLGICLGAQLIASVAGARVFVGERLEFGLAPVDLTEAGHSSCLAALEGQSVLHWHRDTYDLPIGATRLASTASYAEQAFSIGPRILAMQFHVEACGPGFDRWIDAGRDDLASAGIAAEALRLAACDVDASLSATADEILSQWLRGLGG